MRTPRDRGALPPATLDAIKDRHASGQHAGRIANDLALPLSVVAGIVEAMAYAAERGEDDGEGDGIREGMAALRSRQTAPRARGGP